MISSRDLLQEQKRINRERREEKRRFMRLRIAALHGEGLPTQAISERLQLYRGSVLDVMRELGLVPHTGVRP